MSVPVPFQLRYGFQQQACTALLLETDSVDRLLSVVSQIPLAQIVEVHRGFLVLFDQLPQINETAIPLRRLSENCYTTIDSEVEPRLHASEYVELSRKQGLILLPDRLLSFDTSAVRKLTDYLKLHTHRRNRWQALPDVDLPSENLVVIRRIVPVDNWMNDAGPPIAEDDSRPEDAPLPNKVIGKLTQLFGMGLSGFGKLIGSKKIQNSGDHFKKKAVDLSPRVNESILGHQEAALQNLLKNFQSGNVDDALRRAIPFSDQQGRGSSTYTGSELPRNQLGFSLANLLGSNAGSGPSWQGGKPDTWNRLANEYRRAAQAALDRGDYLRAAVIYSKLLGDSNTAAEVLSKGGHHREAATIFRDKMHDTLRAAKEFEAAGEFDEALSLYRKSAQYELAGDLLKRMGEDELALQEYQKSAEELVASKREFLRAGELMFRKTERIDLATQFFTRGWMSRLSSEAIPAGAFACAHKLLEISAFVEPRDDFWKLIAEVDEWLDTPSSRLIEVSSFFNKMMELGDLPHLKAERSQIRDRARVAIGRRLRSQSEQSRFPANVISSLFGKSPVWKPEIISDADFAFRASLTKSPAVEPKVSVTREIKLSTSQVRASVAAADVGMIFVLFEDGSIGVCTKEACYTVNEHKILNHGPIVSLACSDSGEICVGLTYLGGVFNLLCWYFSDGNYLRCDNQSVHLHDSTIIDVKLLPWIERFDTTFRFFLSTGSSLYSATAPIFQLENFTLPSETTPREERTHLLLKITSSKSSSSTLLFQNSEIIWDRNAKDIGWQPDWIPSGRRVVVELSWIVLNAGHLELAGIGPAGNVLYWSSVCVTSEGLVHRTLSLQNWVGKFWAITCINEGKIAVVGFGNELRWYRASEKGLVEFAPRKILQAPLRAVAAFRNLPQDEVVIVMASGEAHYVPIPN